MANQSVISGTRLDIYLEFWGVNDQPPPAPAKIYALELGVVQALLLAAFQDNPQVENGLKSLFQTLFNNGPLDQQFNSLWQNQGQAFATSQIPAAVRQQEPNAYNFQPSYPQQGTLTAITGGLEDPGLVQLLPPGTQGSELWLNFSLSGVSVKFYTTTAFGQFAAPEWNVTFDADLGVSIGVPTDPTIPLVAQAAFATSNTKVGPANFAGWLGGVTTGAGNWVSGALTTLGDWLTQQPSGPGQAQPPPGAPDSVMPVPLSQLGALQSLLADLSKALSNAPVIGFTKLGVVVDSNPPPGTDPGPTVALTLTHPYDPGPAITNPLAPPSGPTFTSPEIGASVTQVNAGGQVGVSGSYFPAAQANELTIQWTDTCSGTVLQSEIQWGALSTAPPANGPVPAPPQPAPDVLQPRNGRFDGQNTFVTPKNLAPSTWYAFRVRDFDVPGIIATDWSAWTAFQTPATSQVDLQLDVSGTSVLVGAGSVGTDGTFSTIAIIPTSVPPGTYVLWAVQGGQQMAQTTITVVAEFQALPPLLQVLNPNTGLAYSGQGIAVGGSTITIRAQHFQPGSVDLYVDSPTGTSVGTVTADSTGAVTAPVMWPYGANGSHNLLAVQGSLNATAAVFGESPAQ